MRRFLTALLLFASLPALAGSQCDPGSAVPFAQAFYQKHYNFYASDPKAIRALLTPPFFKQVKREYDCMKKEGECNLDYDPWLGAQDGEIGKPVNFAVRSQDVNGTVVAMTYMGEAFGVEPSAKPVKHIVLLKLKPAAAPGCWQLDDLVTPVGGSLAKIFAGKAQ